MGRMSKIRVEVVARSNVQRETTLQNTYDLRDEAHIRPQHRHTQTTLQDKDDLKLKYTPNHDTNSSKSRPSIEKKSTFCRNFPLEDLELSIFCHIFAVRKDIRQAHSSTHNRVFFEVRDIYQTEGEFNDRRRETKDWNISRHRHEHNT